MNPIDPVESPHLALWKSCVAEVLATSSGKDRDPGAGIDIDHPMMRGTTRYCSLMEQNATPPKPADESDDAAVQAYLSYLHHRRAHAHIAADPAIEAEIEKQTQEFKLGNPLWQDMYVQYYKYYWEYPYHKGGAPHYRSWQDASGGNGDLAYGTIVWRLPSHGRVALVGDLGTGTDVAAAVLSAALSFNVDAVVHLGDVYYSGTEFETHHRLVGLVERVCGASHRRIPFFTVPGNHEYFTGGRAYLRALDSGRLVDDPSQRQPASYFALRSADDGWQFLGLDTGYYGHFMNVSSAAQATLDKLHIGPVNTASDGQTDPHWPRSYNPYFQRAPREGFAAHDPTAAAELVTVRSDEAQWHHDKLATFSGRSVLISHHQLYSAASTCGVAQKQVTGAGGKPAPDPADFARPWINTGLWRQFGDHFGTRIAAWLWGHEHNLGIFADGYRPADWPQDATFKALPKGRCAGHGSIPVAQAEAPYAAKYPVPLKDPALMLGVTGGWYNRGFEIVELAGAGQPAQVSYYQIAGTDPTPLLVFREDLV